MQNINNVFCYGVWKIEARQKEVINLLLSLGFKACNEKPNTPKNFEYIIAGYDYLEYEIGFEPSAVNFSNLQQGCFYYIKVPERTLRRKVIYKNLENKETITPKSLRNSEIIIREDTLFNEGLFEKRVAEKRITFYKEFLENKGGY